jgi:hypothetical protein
MGTFFETWFALVAGGAIGWGFGKAQQAALRHHQKLEQSGHFKSGWNLMPGSGGRVAMLMMALVLVQVVCPMLFENGIQWWVSGGVVLGYGSVLFSQLLRRRTDGGL